ncbi:MAG: hypothetical protein ACRBG0_18545 [Lewinella sp.]|uniref:hypothetical protein n=1 Tax=Lewinella sp. TaxID=2004506 RepID=UPI003D6BBFFC
MIITDSEGNVFIRNSADFVPPLTWDLGHHGCCPYADSGGGSSGGGSSSDSGGGSGGSSECWFNTSNCTDCPDNLWGDCVFECQGC